MPYNVFIADASGASASVEIYAGGGVKVQPRSIATNHQNDGSTPDRGAFTKTFERSSHLDTILSEAAEPSSLVGRFQQALLKQERYTEGFATLSTAEYEPLRRQMTLHWDGHIWEQSIEQFEERQRIVQYAGIGSVNYVHEGDIDWVQIGMDYAAGRNPDWRSFLPGFEDAA